MQHQGVHATKLGGPAHKDSKHMSARRVAGSFKAMGAIAGVLGVNGAQLPFPPTVRATHAADV